jgi:hypothetical protein
MELLDAALSFDGLCPLTGNELRDPRFIFVASTIGQAESIAFQYLKNFTEKIPGVKYNITKLRCTFPHPRGLCTIQLVGADSYQVHRGGYADGICFDELPLYPKEVRDRVFLPMLSDRLGFSLQIGTPNGVDHFHDLYYAALKMPEIWLAEIANVYDTNIIHPDEIENLKNTMSKEAFAAEFECDFHATPQGQFWAKEMNELRRNGQITEVPYDPSAPCSTYWDLGISDSTSIFIIQFIGRGEIHVIDYIEDHGHGLDYYLKLLRAKGYFYDTHYLPFDIAHRELSTGIRRIDYLIEHGIKDYVIMPKCKNQTELQEDIHRVRLTLPNCWFDEVKCARGIKALSSYQRIYNEKTQTFSPQPQHDWSSHAADSFRGFCRMYENGNPMSQRGKKYQTSSEHNWDVMEEDYGGHDSLSNWGKTREIAEHDNWAF